MAASLIAVARDCGELEVTLVEQYRGTFEAYGCGDVALYRCRDHECTADSGSRGTSPDVAALLEHLYRAEDEILTCTFGSPLTIQFIVEGEEHRASNLRTSIELTEQSRRCIAARIYDLVWLAPWLEGSQTTLVSYTYGGGG